MRQLVEQRALGADVVRLLVPQHQVLVDRLERVHAPAHAVPHLHDLRAARGWGGSVTGRGRGGRRGAKGAPCSTLSPRACAKLPSPSLRIRSKSARLSASLRHTGGQLPGGGGGTPRTRRTPEAWHWPARALDGQSDRLHAANEQRRTLVHGGADRAGQAQHHPPPPSPPALPPTGLRGVPGVTAAACMRLS